MQIDQIKDKLTTKLTDLLTCINSKDLQESGGANLNYLLGAATVDNAVYSWLSMSAFLTDAQRKEGWYLTRHLWMLKHKEVFTFDKNTKVAVPDSNVLTTTLADLSDRILPTFVGLVKDGNDVTDIIYVNASCLSKSVRLTISHIIEDEIAPSVYVSLDIKSNTYTVSAAQSHMCAGCEKRVDLCAMDITTSTLICKHDTEDCHVSSFCNKVICMYLQTILDKHLSKIANSLDIRTA